MATLYILMETDSYDEDYIIAIFSSEERALAYAKWLTAVRKNDVGKFWVYEKDFNPKGGE